MCDINNTYEKEDALSSPRHLILPVTADSELLLSRQEARS